MQLTIFGGSGKTGKHLVEQALAAGHAVKALVRTPAKVSIQHPQLSLIQGDVLDSLKVDETIAGADAVLSVLGPANNKPDFIISRGMEHILSAMRQHQVRRLIISAGAGVRDPQDKPKLIDHFFGAVLKLVSGNVVADMQQVVAKVRTSDRDWTVVRVPMLTDQAPQGRYKVGYVGDIDPRLSRADMAAFMLQQVQETRYVRQAPAISN